MTKSNLKKYCFIEKKIVFADLKKYMEREINNNKNQTFSVFIKKYKF